jgi:hypothetical protein
MKRTVLFLLSLLPALPLFSQHYHINENFNAGSLPSGWSLNTLNGNKNWEFGLDGSIDEKGNNNINGTTFAFFDESKHGANAKNNATLNTPFINLSNQTIVKLEFDYNFRDAGSVQDTFYVDIYSHSKWHRIFSETNDNKGKYLSTGSFPHMKLDISAYIDSNVQIRFGLYDGNGWGWYAGLDNVAVYSPVDHDLKLVDLIHPTGGCYTQMQDSALLQIENAGKEAMSGFTVTVFSTLFNYTDTINDTLPPTATLMYRMKNLIPLKDSLNSIHIDINHPRDTTHANDSNTFAIIIEQSIKVPYLESFEQSDHKWISYGTNNSWAWGVPTAAKLNTAYDGSRVFATNLSGNYNAQEKSYLESPCMDFSSLIYDPHFSFRSTFQTEKSHDNFWVELSLDNGISWNKLLADTTFPVFNWYNNPFPLSWSGNRPWNLSTNLLSQVAGKSNVKIRFVFQSDISTQYEGVLLDQIKIDERFGRDVTIKEILTPHNDNQKCSYQKGRILAVIQNLGALPLDTFYSAYSHSLNPQQIIRDTIIHHLKAGEIRTIEIPTAYSFPQSKQLVLSLSLTTPQDANQSNDTLLSDTLFFNNPSIKHVRSGQIFTENFDGCKSDPAPSKNGAFVCNDWERGNTDYNWLLFQGPSFSKSSGPAKDHTGGNYIYTESYLTKINEVATLTSPCIYLDSNLQQAELRFFYHRYGDSTYMGPLQVEINERERWDLLHSIDSLTHDSARQSFTPATLDLSPVIGKAFKFRFKATNQGCCKGVMALDDIAISEKGVKDIELKALLTPAVSCYGGASDTVTIQLVNRGDRSIFPGEVTAYYQHNSNTLVSEIINDTLNKGELYHYSFKQTIDRSLQTIPHNLYSYLKYTPDNNRLNDSLELTPLNDLYPAPSLIDFDKEFDFCRDPAYYYKAPELKGITYNRNRWRIGSNSCGTFYNHSGPARAHSDTNFLYYTSAHVNNQPEYIQFNCISTAGFGKLNFDFWYHKFGSHCGDIYIEVMDNNQWKTLDSIMGQTQFSPTAPWDSISVSLDSFLNRVIQLRLLIEGYSNSSALYNGMIAFDDFEFYDPTIIDVAAQEEVKEALTLYPNPNEGRFTMEVPTSLFNRSYQIIDIRGARVYENRFTTSRETLDLRNLESGIYFINIHGEVRQQKIIIY